LYSFPSSAYFIDFLKFQYAGEIGKISVGIGKNMNSFYSIEYFHGITFEDESGVEVETLALKNNFKFLSIEQFGYHTSLYAGVAIYHATGLRYQSSRHSTYPDQYYRMGSIRGLFYLGFDIKLSKMKKHLGYFESGINDIVLTNYLNNPDVINPKDYISLALGYGYLF